APMDGFTAFLVLQYLSVATTLARMKSSTSWLL
ncbi:MAG: hypothetical protein ACI9DO_002510, partial [Reinekea sp.]